MWEILVPTTHQNGRPIKTRFHQVWDSRVREISGGLTIMGAVKGQWLYHDKLFEEKVIPCRIIATRKQIVDIIDMTMIYYDQLAVLAYKISDEVILRVKDE